MLLNENIDPNNHKLAKITKGDIIAVKSPGKEAEYGNFVTKYGNEMLFKQPKTGNGFRISAVDGIEGNIVYFFQGNSKTRAKRQFEYISVTDSAGQHKFNIKPIEPKDDDEEEEELSPEEEKVREALENERKEIFSKAQDIEEGDTFSMMFGDVEEDEDGNYTSKFVEKSTSQAYFKCITIYEEIIIAKLTKVRGARQSDYEPYIDSSISFSLDERGLFNQTNNGISIKGVMNNSQNINFQFVYYFNVESSESGEGENNIPKVNPDYNHDLMRLIHHRTWKDRLMGKDGKGIVPLENLRKKFLDGDIKGKKYTTFTLDRDVIVGTGKNLQIKKGEETFGKRHDSGRIIVNSKNGKQTIHLFLKNTKHPDIYEVRIEARDSSNNSEEMGTGKLTIVKE